MTHKNVKTLLAMALALPAFMSHQPAARADAQADYDKNWAPKEARAKTPAERAKLAADLMNTVEKTVNRRKPKKNDDGDEQALLGSLADDRKDQVLLLCNKAYELGCKEPAGYAPAAKALGIIQEIDPDKRLDCLKKLRKLYESDYQIVPATSLGIAKGFAEVNLQLGEEELLQLQQSKSKGKISPAEEVATLKEVSTDYIQGLELVRRTITAIRPYAKGQNAGEVFLESAEALEKDLVDAQAAVAAPLAASQEMDKTLRVQTVMQGRLKTNPADSAAADRLVRLYLNELDDPASISTIVKHASAPVQAAVSLMTKPVKQLTPAQLLSVARCCDRFNDNPASPNRTGMDIRTRVYYEAYTVASKTQDENHKQADLTLKRISLELAKAQLSEDEVKSLIGAYVDALEPPPAVAVAPPPPPDREPDKTAPADDPPQQPDKIASSNPPPPPETKTPPQPAAPEPDRPLAAIKVQPAPEPDPPPAKHDGNSSIFDFGN